MPHDPQNWRTTPGLDPYAAAVPATQRNAADGTVNHATAAAPTARRQSAQWHTVSWNGAAAAS